MGELLDYLRVKNVESNLDEVMAVKRRGMMISVENEMTVLNEVN